MQIRIGNEPLPKGKRFQRVQLKDAIKQARKQASLEKPVTIPEDYNTEPDYIKRDWKIHRICRRCRKHFTTLGSKGQESSRFQSWR